jgi:cytidylate kinase-like protein/BON domain-containing protein
VEAIVLDMATRERVVLSGRGAAFILASVPYVLRVRLTASPAIRAGRIQHRHGLTTEAAVAWVERRDHERAARIRYLYHLDWADPGHYDVVISTDRLSVASATKLVRAALEPPSYEATPAAIQAVVDRRIVAEATETFLRSPVGDLAHISVVSRDGRVTLSGMVAAEEARRAAESSVASLAGVREVLNEVLVLARRPFAGV